MCVVVKKRGQHVYLCSGSLGEGSWYGQLDFMMWKILSVTKTRSLLLYASNVYCNSVMSYLYLLL